MCIATYIGGNIYMKNWEEPEVKELELNMTEAKGNAWGHHDKSCPVRLYKDHNRTCTCGVGTGNGTGVGGLS